MRYSKFNTKFDRLREHHIVPALIGAGAELASSFLSKSAQDEATEKAAGRSLEALKYLENLPEYEYIQGSDPLLEQLPADLQAQLIQEDPTLKSTEISALQKMQELVDSGMDAQDAFNYMQATQKAGTESRGQQEAIINEMQRKGVAGSGTEYALRTRASQDAVDRFAENQAMQAAKNAEIKALANMQQAQLAGNIRGEDFRTANANTDALNNFAMENSRARQANQQRNIDRQNINAQNELSARRAVQQGNVEQARNLATQRANAAQGQAKYDLAQGISQSNFYGNIGNTAGKLGGELYDYYNKPEVKIDDEEGKKLAGRTDLNYSNWG